MNIKFKVMEEKDLKGCALQMIKTFKEEPWNEVWTYEQAYTRFDEIMSARVSRGYVAYDGDTVISTKDGIIPVTRPVLFPENEIVVDDQTFIRPGILVRK